VSADALDVIAAATPVGGCAYLLCDAIGALRLVELAAEEPRPVVLPSRSPMAHTNHGHSDNIARWEDTDLRAGVYPSTHTRLDRAQALLDERPVDVERIRAVLADHQQYPLSICRHPSPAEPTTTAASVVFDCASRTAMITLGNPCTTTSDTLSL
jgi:isopenicillin-N N-acyltransferase like protein